MMIHSFDDVCLTAADFVEALCGRRDLLIARRGQNQCDRGEQQIDGNAGGQLAPGGRNQAELDQHAVFVRWGKAPVELAADFFRRRRRTSLSFARGHVGPDLFLGGLIDAMRHDERPNTSQQSDKDLAHDKPGMPGPFEAAQSSIQLLQAGGRLCPGNHAFIFLRQ